MRIALGLLVVLLAALPSFAGTLTFDERVAAQRAIEEVYWRHRIWPKDNPAPKPSLDRVMPSSAIRAKVEDYLKKSNALETWWHRPITGGQLQAELDRMARGSRDPKLLQELFDALDGDPALIAETLARPLLVDRLIRNWYASDNRFHDAARRAAERGRSSCEDVTCMRDMGGEYSEVTITRRRGGFGGADAGTDQASLTLSPDQWNGQLDRLAARIGGSPESIATGRISSLEESGDGFVSTAVLSQCDDELVITTTSWPKRTFDAWWGVERVKLATALQSSAMTFRLPALDPAGCANDTWSQTNQDVPDGRYFQSAVWTGAEMIVWGGTRNGNFGMNTGGRYNPATDSWTLTSTGLNAPTARFQHTAVWTGTRMVVWGGAYYDYASQQTVTLNSGGRYDPSQDTWATTSSGTNVPAVRYNHTAVWTGTDMIVWGGRGTPSRLNSGGRYNPITDNWTAVSTGANTPSARDEQTAVWTGTQMIVWGGNVNAPTHLNSGGRYDPITDTWQTTSTGANAPAARAWHTALWTGTEMIVWGGQDPVSFGVSTGGRYEPITDTWTATSTGANVPTGRIDHSAVWTGTEMIVWGGQQLGSGSAAFPTTGARYNPSSNSWTPISAGPNAPSGRSNHSAVWTGSEMLVWGGADSAYPPTQGGRYAPGTDSWAPTAAATSSPTGAWIHGAVWTGSEMIVWGGWNETQFQLVNRGGRYDPSTDSWTPTSVGANVPTPRFGNLLWTGTEMIEWGSPSAPYNTGARYNPLTDSWTPTSTGANVPPGGTPAAWTGTEMLVVTGGSSGIAGARYNPVADAWRPMSTTDAPEARGAWVWTGKELIVWGGYNGAMQVNTGRRYNPTTDTWTLTSTNFPVPPPRDNFTAVWTGTEMIVWGGHYEDTADHFLNSGGRYNPSTDSWTATSTGLNCPSERAYHEAVWTGTEMIVWGGRAILPGPFPLQPQINTGGRYNPSTNSWTVTSTGAGAPGPRSQATSVWTGAEMIVWGGQPFTTTGGRYCACPSGRLVYRDADGDGFGDPGVSIGSCDGSTPAGYVLDHGDCNDAIADATDSDHDGEIDACDLDDGLIYEWRNDKTSVSWQAEQGSASFNVYFGDLDVLEATGTYTQVPGSNAIAARECGVTGTIATEAGIPAPGKTSFSLVTGVTGGAEGSLGTSSAGPRVNANPCP